MKTAAPIVVLMVSCFYALTESETSYTWRLDVGVGKIMPDSPDKDVVAPLSEDKMEQELMLDILMSTPSVTNPDGMWKKTWPHEVEEEYCSDCTEGNGGDDIRNNRGIAINKKSAASDEDDELLDDDLKNEVLDCGKPVNSTYYDHLLGVQNRATHPHIPEPEVALQFRSLAKSKSKKEIDIDIIERKLKKSKRDKPKSVELYNHIGNFWRIKGDTRKSIECFRRALAVSPNNADILLNLARVLFNLQYLDDAIFLTRRSLEVQPPDQNAWMQHFQLGEILKAYCHYQEAALHLRHVLELKPNYGPALSALQDMETLPDSTVHMYTILIIVVLVLVVFAWILSTLDVNIQDIIWSSSSNENPQNGVKWQHNGKSHASKFANRR